MFSCATVLPTWANLYPCAGGDGSAGPLSYWCGNGTFCVDKDGTGQFSVGLVPGSVIATAGSPAASTAAPAPPITTTVQGPLTTVTAQQSTTTIVQITCPTTATATANATTTQDICHTGVIASGIGAPLTGLTLAFAGLWIVERRRRRRRSNGTETTTAAGYRQEAQRPVWEKMHQNQMQTPFEIMATNPAQELPDGGMYIHEMYGGAKTPGMIARETSRKGEKQGSFF